MAQIEPQKSDVAKREEAILKFWQDNKIFAKSLEKDAPKGEYVFYEGPPTANGRPGIHHLEARAFKDAIPRYKTMRGYHVRRKGGWDTHGLPVELQVEKELGLKSKKEVEQYGIAAFNQKCKESVWTYVKEWEDFTNRIGYWVDLKDPYVTYQSKYIESLWSIVKKVNDRGLLYKDYKVVPWCPRCGTGLSSHELAQGYQEVKDLTVTVKFKVKNQENTYLLAWTTTPWTLPGNAALAINPEIDYVQTEDNLILAKARLDKLPGISSSIKKEFKGQELVGLEYDPIYPFLPGNENAFKVYAADFVTTEDGTGIVHIAPMYGQDDFELGTKANLPKSHLVNDDGTFKPEAGFLAGRFVKDEAVAVDIIKDLAGRGLLFAKEKYEHSYPHCWRCKTPLIYFARDSWYIKMSSLRDELVRENEGINWEPAHIKEGRFGEWLREIKDWAISRERYWGTPLPVWSCADCKKIEVIGSLEELTAKRQPKNNYWVMRHGEAQSNVQSIVTSALDGDNHLTDNGREQVKVTGKALAKEKIDLIIASPVLRTRETAALMAEALGVPADQVILDERLREVGFGELEGESVAKFHAFFSGRAERFTKAPPAGENFHEVKARALQSLYEIDARYAGKNILLITHEAVGWLLMVGAQGFNDHEAEAAQSEDRYFLKTAESRPLPFVALPHNQAYELDFHRPFIDEVKLNCVCGGEMARVKEVMDVWFDSGSMPFAQDHYPFSVTDQELYYPADFISEAIDQTRGWFYTMHAVGVLLGKGKAYKNVVCLGHILDAEGKKMSKSLGNIVNPWTMIDKYGADALRLWMYSVNQPGDSKNFDEKTVDEVGKKVFNLASNVLAFYQTYADLSVAPSPDSTNILDRWILARLNQLIAGVTTNLDSYNLFEPTRAIRDFVGDLSQWYLRRSRERFKSDNQADARAAAATTRYVLTELAKVMAPFAPFFAEELYLSLKGNKESVHLEPWPESGKSDEEIITAMQLVRQLVSGGLEARAKAAIKVRQPLKELKAKSAPLSAELTQLIQDEVNVKAVIFDPNLATVVELDLTITSELKEEGELRDLIREIQEWRKESGLKAGEQAEVLVPVAKRSLAEKYEREIRVATNASAFRYE